eukprot:TRINITY_DN921_c0_g1_i1.p1 TRINITY_DN921_c0_g1~~TRINITY_DN921_c0_g1_i1.p1  ORF type:complete len:312 (+),score=44.28 TRINITY_DN921_c0_g1_i1:89-1024(+)
MIKQPNPTPERKPKNLLPLVNDAYSFSLGSLPFPSSIVQSLIPPLPEVRNDIDKIFVCLFLNTFLLLSSIIAIVMCSNILLHPAQDGQHTTIKGMVFVWLFVAHPLPLFFLNRTGNATLTSHFVLCTIFSFSLISCYLCGGFNDLLYTPYPLIPALSAFLFSSRRCVVFYWTITLCGWVINFIVIPFPTPTKCINPDFIPYYSLFAIIALTVFFSVMGVTFAKVRKLKQKHLELETERTAKLTQTHIEFSRTIAHEIKTPLSTVIGYSDLLIVNSSLLPEHKKILQEVLTASEELRVLLDKVLLSHTKYIE